MNDETIKKLKVAAIRAGRVFGITFVGYFLAKWQAAAVHGDYLFTGLVKLVEKDWDPALGLALNAALLGFGLNIKKPISPESK